MTLKKERKKNQDDEGSAVQQHEKINNPYETIVESYIVTNGKKLNLISYHRSWKWEYETRVYKDNKDDDHKES